MTVEEKIQALLIGSAAITALVPASRIKTPGEWQNLGRPYIVHFPVSVTPIDTHQGRAALTAWEFYQVSIFASSYGVGKEVAFAVRDNLPQVTADGVQIFWRAGSWYAGKDDTTGVHHFALNFRVVEAL